MDDSEIVAEFLKKEGRIAYDKANT